MNENLIPAPAKYAPMKGKASLVYDAICKVLSERQGQVDWAQFDKVKWRLFAQMAETEGVGPLLYWYLGRQGNWILGPDTKVPGEVQRFLQGAYYQSVAQNAMLLQELERILVAFEQAEIPVIVLKGAALAQTLYPDLGIRPMSDVDLLVMKADLEWAGKTIQSLGFRPTSQPLSKSWRRNLDHHYAYKKQSDNVRLEIHWNLLAGEADWREPDINWFWEQAQTAKYPARGRMVTLPPTANLLYLAAHLYLKHGGREGRLIWAMDLAQLIESQWENGINQNLLIEKAMAFNWLAALYRALENNQVLTGEQSTRALTQRLAQSYQEAIIPIRSATGIPQPHSLNTWNFLKNLDNAGRIKALFALLIPSREHILWRYKPDPKWSWPVYYVKRWGEVGRNLIQAGIYTLRKKSSLGDATSKKTNGTSYYK